MSDPPQSLTVTIGSEKITLPKILNFLTLERLWPSLQVLADSKDNVTRAAAALGIVSAVVIEKRPELTVAELKKRLMIFDENGIDERTELFVVVDNLLIASGLVRREEVPGEGAAPGNQAPGAATGPISPTS